MTEVSRVALLIDFARQQGWDIVGMTVSAGQIAARQWAQAVQELDDGQLAYAVRWDHGTDRPVTRQK
jgi:hypothetical protein